MVLRITCQVRKVVEACVTTEVFDEEAPVGQHRPPGTDTRPAPTDAPTFAPFMATERPLNRSEQT